ncbi:hypothetical protein C8R44DRAFT_876995 [Mycena epipterygia]|nr:hypothetical protein C8R44DRAFT_876995 [Mycena epipterygia]
MSFSESSSSSGGPCKKRKRGLSARGDVVMTEPEPASAAKTNQWRRHSFNMALSHIQWSRILTELAAAGTVVPQLSQLFFYETSDCVNHFKSSQTTLQCFSVRCRRSPGSGSRANGAVT